MKRLAEVPQIFDRKALALRKSRAARRGGENVLAEEAARGIAHRLAAVNRRFTVPMALDIPDPAFDVLKGYADNWVFATLGEQERLPLEHDRFDLVVSVLSLHAINDLPGVLVQIRRALKPDGLFMAALLGGDSLAELREAFATAESEIEGGLSPRVAPFADLRELGALMQRAGFALPVIDSDRLTVRYDNAFALMRDLRAMGATNVLVERRRMPLRRATLLRMAEIYAERFSDPDGRVRATFEIAWLSGWAPHESQQKPLKPGSAAQRLADALGARELPAGEKIGR